MTKIIEMEDTRDNSVKDFHRLYYENSHRTWKNTFFLGFPVQKCPLDLWIYQEIIFKIKPDLIIETGTADGGSALYLAVMCDLIENGEVITIDIEKRELLPQHKRLSYLVGSSISQDIIARVSKMAADKKRTLIILDSDHGKEHVYNEILMYKNFTSIGSYIIVEDTNINGNPVLNEFGPGPCEAVSQFLIENQNFIIDSSCEKFYFSFNHGGYLKRVT